MDWSALPLELLEMISVRLPTVRDYIRFRAVCVPWRYATAAAPRHFSGQLPWLMMPTRETSDFCDFFSLSHNQIHRLHLPELRKKLVCGSSYGWVAAIDTTSLVISLLNPLTRAQIHLPPLNATIIQSNTGKKQGRNHVIKKVVLSSNPTSPDGCVAVAISTRTPEIRICRVGEDKSWTLLHWFHSREYNLYYACQDAVFFEGKLYAVDTVGRIIICDADPTNPRARFESSAEYSYDCPECPGYLVALSGKLLFVKISYHEKEVMEVFDVDPREEWWVKMHGLGDGVPFVGKNNAFSLIARDFLPGGIKENCIFFADDRYSIAGINCGVYDFEEGGFKQLPCYDPAVLRSTRPFPIWFMPSLC